MTAATQPDNEWQRIWFSLRQHGWSSIVLVPSHPGGEVLRVAERLADTARAQGERPVTVLNGTKMQLGLVQQMLDDMAVITARGEQVIIPIDAITDNPSGIAIVQASSAALLVVRLGESAFGDAQATLEACGREHFMGSIVLDQGMKPVLR